MIKLRYGGLDDSYEAPSYDPFWKLGKIFKCSATLVRKLVQAKFVADSKKKVTSHRVNEANERGKLKREVWLKLLKSS